MTDAVTDPRPRVTKRIGNAQQTSVVRAVVSPTMLLTRSVRMSLLRAGKRQTNDRKDARRSDAERR